MSGTHLHPLIWGAISFIVVLPVTYFMFNEIKWKFALGIAIGMTIGASTKGLL